MKVALAFITYNRLDYTKLALRSILANDQDDFALTIWDNASTDGTAEYLSTVDDPRIAEVILSKENAGQIAAVNEIWAKSKADLLGKLDNDCLMTPGWVGKLAEAHEDIPELGVVACWHYPLDEFDEQAARKAGKIQQFGDHQIVRHPWTCGTGLLLKRSTYERFGRLQGKGTTRYWMKIAYAGLINGYHFPLIPQEHMDDPRSRYTLVSDDESVRQYGRTACVLRDNGINTIEDRWKRRQMILRNLNAGPWDVRHYTGWRGRLKNFRERLWRSFKL